MSKQNDANWSYEDNRVNKITGFIPGDREKRQCIICDQKGHYYYECNGGQFLKDVDKLVEGIKLLSSTETQIDKSNE